MADFYMLNQRFLDDIKAIDTQDPEYIEKIKTLNAKYENLKATAPKYDPFSDMEKTINDRVSGIYDLLKTFQDQGQNGEQVNEGYMKYETSCFHINSAGQRQEIRVSKSRKLIDGKEVEVQETTKKYEDDEKIVTETIDRNGKRSVTTKNKKPVYQEYILFNTPTPRQLWRNLTFPSLLW